MILKVCKKGKYESFAWKYWCTQQEINFWVPSGCNKVHWKVAITLVDMIGQQVTHKGGESAMNYIKILQNSEALSVYVGNSYSEDQMKEKYRDNFHQGENTQLK